MCSPDRVAFVPIRRIFSRRQFDCLAGTCLRTVCFTIKKLLPNFSNERANSKAAFRRLATINIENASMNTVHNLNHTFHLVQTAAWCLAILSRAMLSLLQICGLNCKFIPNDKMPEMGSPTSDISAHDSLSVANRKYLSSLATLTFYYSLTIVRGCMFKNRILKQRILSPE